MSDVIGVTGFDDPEGEAPWGMPIAFLVDKQAPATSTAICEAAASAVVQLLADERATSGEWASFVQRWMDGRIRKVVRRGRRPQFDRAAQLPGITVVHAGATVRAFVPGPTDQLPPELNRLQVSGSEPPEVGTPAPGFVTVAVNPDLVMSVGKLAAQSAHAAQLAWASMSPADRKLFAATGYAVRLEHPTQNEWKTLRPLARASVVDAGFTEIPPGSNTTIALY